MEITMDTLVNEILEAYPAVEAVFEKHGVHVSLECRGVMDNPLELCDTLCSIDDIDGLLADLQELTTENV